MSIIKDGTGTGKSAKVNVDNQLEVHAAVASQHHWYSEVKGQAYQVYGVTDTLTSATIPILHMKNTSSDKELVIVGVQFQTADDDSTLPSINEYFAIGFGRTYSSVGTAIVPTNLNTSSGNAAEVTAFHSTPTLAGTNVEIDRVYNKADGDIVKLTRHGAIIVGPNDTIEFYIVSTSTAGVAYASVGFYMETIGAG